MACSSYSLTLLKEEFRITADHILRSGRVFSSMCIGSSVFTAHVPDIGNGHTTNTSFLSLASNGIKNTMLIIVSMNLFKLCKNYYLTGVGCKINKINSQSRIKLQKKQSFSVKTRILVQIYKKHSHRHAKYRWECEYHIRIIIILQLPGLYRPHCSEALQPSMNGDCSHHLMELSRDGRDTTCP